MLYTAGVGKEYFWGMEEQLVKLFRGFLKLLKTLVKT